MVCLQMRTQLFYYIQLMILMTQSCSWMYLRGGGRGDGFETLANGKVPGTSRRDQKGISTEVGS